MTPMKLHSPLGDWHAHLVDRVLSSMCGCDCFGPLGSIPFFVEIVFFIVEGLLLESLVSFRQVDEGQP